MGPGPSLAGRTAMAVLLTLGFYGLAFGLVTAILWFISEQHDALPATAGLFTVIVIVQSVLPHVDDFAVPGIRLRADQQPELFRVIQEIADTTYPAMPVEVFLIGTVDAFVSQRGGMLGIFSRRVMGIGLPLLEILTVAQLRAVLSHEFGHFHGGEMRLGPWIYKTRAAIVFAARSFARARSLLRLPFHWYAAVFVRVTQPISRRQELAADALSVQVAGPGPVRSALTAVVELAPLWRRYYGNELAGIISGGFRPPVAGGFRRFLHSPAAGKARARAKRAAATADSYDTHPPLGERLAAVGGRPGPRDAGDPIAAITLLRDLPALERDLLAFLYRDPAIAQLPAASWDEAPELALPQLWRGITFDHCGNLPELKVADLAAQRACLDELVRLLQIEADTCEQRHDQAAALLGAMLAFRLHETGFEVDAAPGHPIRLVRGEVALQPLQVLMPIDEGGMMEAEWRLRCATAGIGALPLTGKSARPATRAERAVT